MGTGCNLTDNFVNTMCSRVYKSPAQISWVGDYSDDLGFRYYDEVWGENVITYSVKNSSLLLKGKYLCNHKKKRYIDFSEYIESCSVKYRNSKLIAHPLPLLTAFGNGFSSTDYYGTGRRYIGKWQMDEISIEDNIPKRYRKLKCLCKIFKVTEKVAFSLTE